MITTRPFIAPLLAAALWAGPAAMTAARGADISEVFALEVQDASAKVGEKGAVTARVRVQEGYRLLEAYDNRLTRLSAQDDSVTFEGRVLKPSARPDGDLLFTIPVVPTKPGRHPINGVFRIGYIEADTMKMVSVPLMASVTGTE